MNRQLGKRRIIKVISVMVIVTLIMSACGNGDASNVEVSIIEAKGAFYFIRQRDDNGNLNFTEDMGSFTLKKDIETLLSDGSIPVTGADVASAKRVFSTNGFNENEPLLDLSMTEEGTEKFREMTEEAYQNDRAYVAICFDGEILCAPRVQQPILDGHVVITGLEDAEKMEGIASAIEMGEMKVTLKKAEEKYFEIPQDDEK